MSLKKIRKHLYRIYYRNAPWMKLINECQSEIATTSCHAHYLEAYRKAEIFYWIHIPKWLFRMKSEGFQVTNALDIGCAYGTLALYTQRVFGANIYCTDFTKDFLSDELSKRYNFNFSLNNIEREDFPWKQQFDLIIFTEVFEHLNFHPVATLKKLKSLLTLSGKLVLTTPDAKEWGKVTKYYSSVDEIPVFDSSAPLIDDHIWQYSRDELLAVIKESGFTIDQFDYSPGMPARHFNLVLSANI